MFFYLIDHAGYVLLGLFLFVPFVTCFVVEFVVYPLRRRRYRIEAEEERDVL